MLDELVAIKAIHAEQKRKRLLCGVSFVTLIVIASLVLVAMPKVLPGLLYQLLMIISMACVFGLFFLDRISFMLTKKFYQKDILHKYLFEHSRPDDIHKDPELVVDLISRRRKAAQEKKQLI